jgi:hypothetical protein
VRRLIAASSFLLSLLVGSVGRASPKNSPSPIPTTCVPSNATSALLELERNPARHQLPVRIRLLGFSRHGRFALLEQREGEEIEGGLWTVRVIDLETNGSILEEELETDVDTMDAFCESHRERLSQILAIHQIEASPLPKLVQLPITHQGIRISLALRRGNRTTDAVRPFEIWLSTKGRPRQLGVVEQIYVESGRDPTGAPRVLGVLTSPFEPRIAVLIRQDLVGTEAAVIPLVRVFGAKL